MGLPHPSFKIDIAEKSTGSRVFAPHDSFLVITKRVNHAWIPRASDFFNSLLEGNTKSTRAYAWASPIEGSDKKRIFAVLHLGGIRSPQDAVKAAIVAEQRATGKQ
jgi:hypothetical protein